MSNDIDQQGVAQQCQAMAAALLAMNADRPLRAFVRKDWGDLRISYEVEVGLPGLELHPRMAGRVESRTMPAAVVVPLAQVGDITTDPAPAGSDGLYDFDEARGGS